MIDELNELIEKIVYMIFNCEVESDEPETTIKQIKEKLRGDKIDES